MSSVSVSEFGAWKSPISSKLATESSVSFQEIHVDKARGKEGVAYWTELRYDEAGRYVVCSKQTDQAKFSAWTPAEMSARTLVHEYGGGAFTVHDGAVYFTNYKDQRMYVQKSAEDAPQPLSPENSGWNFADAEFFPMHGSLYCVREDHSLVNKKEAKEATNTIVAINTQTQQQHVLVSGCDFYSSPRVSPNGKHLAWIQWNHPNMPWDTTELWRADLTPGGDAVIEGSAKKVAGGGNTSVMYPRWTPDNELLYIGDQTDWWNLYHVTGSGDHVNLRPLDVELGTPHWQFAWYPYDLDPSGSSKMVTSYGRELGILDFKTRDYKKVETGFTGHDFLQYGQDGNIYCVAGSPEQFPCVIKVNPDTNQVDILRHSREVPVDKNYISVPKQISWSSGKGATSHGNLYLPQNKDFKGPASSLPPLLVKAHGGPTAQTWDTLNLKIQYFTSRGFAILDVNYRGSTGYGKQYRHALRGNWGIYDIEDCSSGAKHLADTKQVDSNRLCIDGGSAGGYTTLACLAFTDVFKAGASHYGVADLAMLALETHKFESRYLDVLIAPYNDENKKIYDSRSPIKNIEQFNCSIAFFQGDEDKIVPPNQAEMMFKEVKAKGLPCTFVLFQGEQHGFRKAENMQKALDGEFYFFAKVFGYEPADKHCQLEIENL